MTALCPNRVPRSRANRPRCAGLALLIGVALAAPGGCSRVASMVGPTTGGTLSVQSTLTGRGLSAPVVAAAYVPVPPPPGVPDPDTADIYLSDLPQARLTDLNDDLSGLTGSITHIHLFLTPDAGRTPIDRTACNVAIRTIVLACAAQTDDAAGRSVVGLYTGGGFVLPSRDPGDSTYAGRVLDLSLRLAAADPGFADPLSPASMTGSFSAPLDAAAGPLLAARFERLAQRAQANPVTTTNAAPSLPAATAASAGEEASE